MDKNDILLNDFYYTVIKPAVQALIVGGASLVCYEAVVHKIYEAAIISGVADFLLLKKYLFEGNNDLPSFLSLFNGQQKQIYNLEANNILDEPNLKEEINQSLPWENPNKIVPITKITIYHENKYGPGPVWWYELPVLPEKMSRISFHVMYLNGRFSHNYLSNPKRNPKIITKENFGLLQHYLVDHGAATWRNGYSQNGVVMLDDGLAMLQYYSKLYYPLPHEKKPLKEYGKRNLRYQNRQAQTEIEGEQIEELRDVQIAEEN